jgi:Pyruvate/2-oxoacid:ferredoxin oxidoreductase delta subunit
MATLPVDGLRVVLYEGSGSAPVEPAERLRLMSALLDAGYPVARATSQDELAPVGTAPVLVLGSFAGANQPPADGGLHFRDIAGLENGDPVAAAEELRQRLGGDKPGTWTPWFPVIDFDRCTNCMQCLSFCLFDVYAVDREQRITVQNQSNCKTSCPACSRVCPEAAIMFPKYAKGPINGAPVAEADVQRESMKVDISALLGGDVYSALRTRQRDARQRFSTERDESKALLERKRCLKKLQEKLDIPDEVLMSLPSTEAIEERARRAREKQAKRLERSQTARDRHPGPGEEEWGI